MNKIYFIPILLLLNINSCIHGARLDQSLPDSESETFFTPSSEHKPDQVNLFKSVKSPSANRYLTRMSRKVERGSSDLGFNDEKPELSDEQKEAILAVLEYPQTTSKISEDLCLLSLLPAHLVSRKERDAMLRAHEKRSLKYEAMKKTYFFGYITDSDNQESAFDVWETKTTSLKKCIKRYQGEYLMLSEITKKDDIPYPEPFSKKELDRLEKRFPQTKDEVHDMAQKNSSCEDLLMKKHCELTDQKNTISTAVRQSIFKREAKRLGISVDHYA